MSERSRLLNAAIGAVVSIVFMFLPFSPVLGGAAAGYLERGDYRDGATVGAISGAIAMIPMALFATLILAFFVIVPVSGGRPGVGLFFGFLFLVVGFLFLLYTVGLSALGGVIGVAIADELRDEPRGTERLEDSECVEPPVRVEDESQRDEL